MGWATQLGPRPSTCIYDKRLATGIRPSTFEPTIRSWSTVNIIGASVSEPPLVDSTDALYIYILSGAYEPPEGRKERPTPHYSVERHLNLDGRHTSLIWTYSQVGRKCCFHKPTRYATRPAFACCTALAMTVNELHVFLSSQLKQERERKIERLGKRQALYTRLYFPRGFRSRKWPSYAAICGVRDTAHFRRCASSSLGIFLRVYVASWLAAFRAFRSHVLFFLFHRCELRTSRTTSNYFTIVARAVRGRYNEPSIPVVFWL